MPMRLTVSPLDRLVIGVASGAITVADLVDFVRQLGAGEIHHFRKIIDITAGTPDFSPDELSKFSEGLRTALKDTPRGALAIVASDKTSGLARLFGSVTGDGRPIDVFSSIHEARKWLNSNAFPR
jgi:hypothetical protein